MKDLVTRKMTINSGNPDQISFVIDLVNGYDEGKLTDIEIKKNDEFFYNTVLTKAKKVFLDTKKIKKGIKSFFSKEI